jgi:N-acetylneuraminate synthase
MLEPNVQIIAEAGVNHDGDLSTAFRLVEVAAEAGADSVKFQTFRADALVTLNAAKADYQKKLTKGTESQFEMLQKLELSKEDHFELLNFCKNKQIRFLSTPFDRQSLRFLIDDLGLEVLKIGSGEITNGPLLLDASRSGRKIILSTGMSSIDEISECLSLLAFGYVAGDQKPCKHAFKEAFSSSEGRKALQQKITLLHCTSEYPAPLSEVNLRAMSKLHSYFCLPVGYSDHTQGIEVGFAAVALGASIIEKHFTLDKSRAGPDHKASLEPKELQDLVSGIRKVEVALGNPKKMPTPSELKNRPVVRKSLVASRDIKKGERFNEENIEAKRPGTGVSPMQYWTWFERTADRDYKKNELIGN